MGAALILVFDILESAVSDFLGWVLVSLVGAAVAAGWKFHQLRVRVAQLERELRMNEDPTRLESQEEAIERFARWFEGDPSDPADVGLLEQVHDIDRKLDDIKHHLEDNDK